MIKYVKNIFKNLLSFVSLHNIYLTSKNVVFLTYVTYHFLISIGELVKKLNDRHFKRNHYVDW